MNIKNSSPQKVDEKNHLPNFFFLSLVMVLKLPKRVNFLQTCADLSKKPESIKAILNLAI